MGPVTRLDHSELLCNKVLFKYKRDRESFWDRHQKGAERAPPDGLQANGIRLLVVVVFCSVVSDSLRPHGLRPARLLCPWDSPGKNTGVDCHSLFQRIFPTQGSNPGLLHCRQILYRLSYREDPYSYYQSANERKEMSQNSETGTRPLTNNVHFEITLAQGEFSLAIK